MNLLHEQIRYYNFYVQDYWCQLHGQDFIGRLWQESTRPEDPVEAYQRLNNQTQADFCRDMYDYACRAITWDIDGIRERGRGLSDMFTTRLHDVGDGWLEIDSAYCPQNYGFNVIRLNLPEAGTTVKADFLGEAGAPGYRAYNVDKAGWRYGFVALTTDNQRVYGPMFAAPEGTATFSLLENSARLWFVVSGAPTTYWTRDWLSWSEESTAEQWPYRFKLYQTNVYGKANNNQLPTGIQGVIAESQPSEPTAEQAVYDLQGRRLANGQLPKAKGLYIIHGRKVFIK